MDNENIPSWQQKIIAGMKVGEFKDRFEPTLDVLEISTELSPYTVCTIRRGGNSYSFMFSQEWATYNLTESEQAELYAFLFTQKFQK